MAPTLRAPQHAKLAEAGPRQPGKGPRFQLHQADRFFEACVKGKHKKSVFKTIRSNRAAEPQDLIHSDLCGKMNAHSFGGAEYFLTFVDDRTHYTWVYLLKHKDEAFDFPEMENT